MEYFEKMFPFPQNASEIQMIMSPAEFASLKMSSHPEVRSKHFNIYSNSCESNADKILQMVKLRSELALTAKQKDFWTMRKKT